MKTLIPIFMVLLIFGCASQQIETGDDFWLGMTPEQHADMLMDKPDKKIPLLGQKDKDGLWMLLDLGMGAVSGAIAGGMVK